MLKTRIISCLLLVCLLCSAAACTSQETAEEQDTARLSSSISSDTKSTRPAVSSQTADSAAPEESEAQGTNSSAASNSTSKTPPRVSVTLPPAADGETQPPAESADTPAGTDTQQPAPTPHPDETGDSQTVQETPEPAELTPDDIFTANLLSRQYQSGQNLFLSPLSIQQALGMTANGASGSTLDGILQATGYTSLEEMQKQSGTYQQLLAKTPGYFTLANGIWLDSAFAGRVNPAFLEANKQYYNAEVSVEPLNGTAVGHINDWVSRKTNRLIPSIIDHLDGQSRMVLVNTLLFNGKWARPFDPNNTSVSTFHGAKGDIKLKFMPQMMPDSPWYEADDWCGTGGLQATRLDYDDGRTSMLVALPEDLDGFMQQLTPTALHDLCQNVAASSPKRVSLIMPRFSVTCDSGDTLGKALAGMGMQDAFSLQNADFSRLSSQGDEKLCIGQILHKTVLQVGEKGTTAAAATGEALAGGALPDKSLVLNRPFFCAILDKQTGAIYFAGAVCQPEVY